MSRTVLVLAVVTVLATAVNALYGKNSAVIALTPDNFKEEVIESSHVWVVEFFAPWCGHCQRLAPDYEKAATNLKGLVKVGAVNCDEEKSKPLCGTYGVQGFPTIKIFPSELTPAGKRSDQLTKTPFDYQGERSARAIVDFALSQLPLYVKKVASKPGKRSLTLEDFLADQADKLSHVILFTSKTTTTPLFKALAVDFKDRLVLGEVASTDSEIISKYNVDKFPTLIVIPKEADAAPVTYSGALKHDEIFAFLEPFALPVEKKAKSSSSGSSPKKEAPPEEPFNPEVAFVQTQAELEKECLNKPIGTCIIAFLEFDPEYDRSVKEHQENIQILRNLKQRAHDKKQAFHFLWVKASDQAELRNSFGISDIFPAVLAVSPSRNVFRPFVGGFDESVLSEFIDEYQIGRGGRFFKFTHAIKLNEQTPPSTAE